MSNVETLKHSRELMTVWRSIFSGRPLEPFVDLHWEVFLLPHELVMEEKDFYRLVTAAKAIGDPRIIVSDLGASEAANLDWNADLLVDLIGHRLVVDDTYLFGRSAKWGMVCTHDDFSILGGVAEFMDSYASEAGGRDRLREAFMQWIQPPGWFVPSHITQELLALARWKAR